MSVFGALLISTFVVSRTVRTSNGYGGWRPSWEYLGSYSGRLRPASGSEITVAAQQQREMTHVLYLEADANIERGDMIVGEGHILDVQAVREPSHAGHHLEIDCRERIAGREAEEESS